MCKSFLFQLSKPCGPGLIVTVAYFAYLENPLNSVELYIWNNISLTSVSVIYEPVNTLKVVKLVSELFKKNSRVLSVQHGRVYLQQM